MSNVKLGTVCRYHKGTFDDLALGLFRKNGRLVPTNPNWNCAAKVSKAIAEVYQSEHPDADVPEDTWRKKFVRSFLDRHPELDLEVPRRRRK